MQGNIACAEGALAAGCSFMAGYPITPASEISERLAARLPALDGSGGVFIQMEDEISSLAAVIGASWTGAKAMTATSGPGISSCSNTSASRSARRPPASSSMSSAAARQRA
jgi:2-oxoglutarate ferredoxin oxidoreductase subunit alpha